MVARTLENMAIPRDLAHTVENHWKRFTEKLDALPDRESAANLLQSCRSRRELRMVWAGSEYIAGSCIASPLLLYDLICSGDLDQGYGRDGLDERAKSIIAVCDNEDQLHARLRRFRQREMIRLAWRDLGGMAELEETMSMVSALADISIRIALAHHHRWLSRRYGQPMGEGGQPASLIVLGLGKLGGNELNYSSDVDLMFAYDLPGKVQGATHRGPALDNQEYFVKLGRKIIAALDTRTADGIVFRTDMRLRPNGDSGPLVLSFPALEHYYQTHGRSWERYALVKARVIAGDPHAGAELLDMLRPFVYRKYLDFSAYEAIREMKSMIYRELKQQGTERNIKLGWGGIREIEFFVQSHQLIQGGREKSLQTQSLYEAIHALQELGEMEGTVRRDLIQSYRFLRNTEHRLQMVADRQTQQLPESDYERLRLAWSMGFETWDEYAKVLDHHRHTIHGQFRRILDADAEHESLESFRLQDVWHGRLPYRQAVEALVQAGFPETNTTPELLNGFRQGRLYQAFSGAERDRMDRLVPLAIQQAAKHPDADRAMAAFISVVEAIGRRSVYLSLLIENPIALKQLLHLCAASRWISNHIGRHPVILDELLNPLADIRNRSRDDLESELSHRLSQLDGDDEEGWMNTLREYQHAQVLQIAAADISGELDVMNIHQGLTRLANVLVHRVFDDAVRSVSNRLGSPSCQGGMIAYGKFASSELGYHSDLDVIVCFDSPDDCSPAEKMEAEYFYGRVGKRLIHLLTTRTRAGYLYQLDMRLRPSGRSGTLVTSLSGFSDYQLRHAWTWEHQALVRARVVIGNEAFTRRFEEARRGVLVLERDPGPLREDIRSMRRKMIDANCQSNEQVYDIKLDEGGIVDIEFLVQYWILRESHEHAELTEPRTTSACIAALVEQSVIDSNTGEEMLHCYETYLRHSLNLKLMDRPVLARQSELLAERSAIKSIWAETFG